MKVLGIESSCDDTGLAIVENGQHVLGNVLSSQWHRHAEFGGVVPEIAAREHLNDITPLAVDLFEQADCRLSDIDLIAVTQGPGLIGSLLVGQSFARGLSVARNIPLIPVNHVHAHVHGAFLKVEQDFAGLFPALAVVVSGGHTHIYYMSSPVHFKLLAATFDDACGECFDKIAKLMGLSYPGGPAIEQLAKKGDANAIEMPVVRPKMVSFGARDKTAKIAKLSYSGLKTHVAYYLSKAKLEPNDQQLFDLCAAFQKEAFMQLVRGIKLLQPLCSQKPQSIIVAGGVSANHYFRNLFANEISIPTLFPSAAYCSDNGAMVAALGYYLYDRLENSAQTGNDSAAFVDAIPQNPLDSWEAFSKYPYEQTKP